MLTLTQWVFVVAALLVITLVGRVFWWIARAWPGVSPRSWRWLLVLIMIIAVVVIVVLTTSSGR